MPETHSHGGASSCRACSDERDMFAAMRKSLYSDSMKQSKHASSPSQSLPPWPRLPCPPDNSRLGRATWTFLHSMAAYYPAQPSDEHKQHARSLLASLPTLYPCDTCAEHLQHYYADHPYADSVHSRQSLSHYLCRVHNEVRSRQGKREFECSRVLERWGGRDWQPTDECDDEREYGDVDELANSGE